MNMQIFRTRRGLPSLVCRMTAILLIPVLFMTMPGTLRAEDQAIAEHAEKLLHPDPVIAPTAQYNTNIAKTAPPTGTLHFSSQPADQEFFVNSPFKEPLVPIDGATTPGENEALAQALTKYLQRKSQDDFSAIEGFLNSNPNSAWRLSLLTNMGLEYRKTGYYSKSLSAWEEVWKEGKTLKQPSAKATVDRALAELISLNASLGRVERLDPLLAGIKGRNITGSAEQKIEGAEMGVTQMHLNPSQGYRCGPLAVEALRSVSKSKIPYSKLVNTEPSSVKGTNLTQVYNLSQKVGLNLQMAKRSAGSAIVTPAIIHWKVGHFAAAVAQTNGLVHMKDPTFGDDVWITQAALDAEADGYELVKSGELPSGWTSVNATEGKTVWGKGPPTMLDPNGNAGPTPRTHDSCNGEGGSESGGGGAPGTPEQSSGGPPQSGNNQSPGEYVDMAGYSIYEMEASLCVQDTPVYYNPAYGPPLHFTISYSQREMNQPSTFTYSNMGPLWTFNFLTYITDDPQSTTSNVTQYLSGGGTLTYTYDSNISGFDPQPSNMGQLTRLSSTSYQLVLWDGSIQYFSTPGPGSTSRNIYLTETKDPFGNTLTFNYDTTYRLTSVLDAAGHAMTINYVSNSQSNSGYYLIAGVKSYDGRTASFTYDSGGNLASSTDMSGMTSSFYYTNGVMSSMVTPYGTTTFSTGQDGLTRWVQATDPQGGTERVETWGGVTPLYQLTSPPPQPPGCDTQYLSDRNTFHWTKEAWAEAPHDYNAAEIIHWLQFNSNASAMSDIPESFKPPNESRVCYEYPNQPTNAQGQTVTLALGSTNQPTETLRVLDNGTTQQTNITYNAQGNLLQEEDADGRYTTYVYAANGIDVTDVYQGQNSSGDHIGHYTYYPNTHEIETYTNAAGQSETFTYTGHGQIASVLDANSNTVTYNYDTNGYLKSIVGPIISGGSLSVSFTRDSYNRIGSITDVNGYTRQFAYDLLDRRTLVTYPDGTTDEDVYKNMDLFQHKDRQGHWTNYFYNAADQLVAKVDPNNHYTNYNRCICGALLGIQDPDGNWTKVARDVEGRVLTKTYADGSQYTYTYNGVGQVSTILDPKGQTTTYGYTTSGLLASLSYSGVSIATPSLNYTWDTVYPRVKTMVDGIGTTQYTYYPAGAIGAGNVETETNPLTGATLTYSYDKKSRFTGVSISDGYSSSIAFDGADRLSSAQNQLGTFTYSYYAGTPRLKSITNSQNSLSTSYSYQTGSSQDFRLTDITNYANASTILSKFDYTYTADGDLLSWQEQTGSSTPTIWNYNYDNGDQLLNATKSNTQTQAVVSQYGYGFDPAGNRQTNQDGLSVDSTSFNNLNQPTSSSPGGNLIVQGTINKAASVTVNGSAATVTGTTTFKATTPVTAGTNTLTVVATNLNGYASTNKWSVAVPANPATTPLYDADGNLLNNGNGQTYQWDAKNELVGISYANGNSTSFSYDGVGRRVQIVEKANGTVTATRNFIWVGNTPADEHNAAGTVTKRYYGQGEQISGTNYYYTRDHLGSVREMTDGSGNVQSRYQYDPDGVASTVGTLLIGSDVQYAGYFFHAASALLLTLYRAYDCNSARWLSRDPSGERGGSFSLYAFNTNNAVRFVDSLGLCPKECQGLQDAYDAAQAKVNRDQDTINEDNEQIFIDQGRIAVDLVFLGLSAAALYLGAVKARGIIGAIEIIAGLIGLGAFGIALALDSRQLANDQRKLATDTENMAADAREAMADYTALEQCDLKYSGPPFIGPLPPIPSS